MKTPYNEIVNIASIGSQTNPISLNEILRKANDEQLTPAAQNKERVLFLGIDVQQDFMDNGALGVPGAHGDVEKLFRISKMHLSIPRNVMRFWLQEQTSPTVQP